MNSNRSVVVGAYLISWVMLSIAPRSTVTLVAVNVLAGGAVGVAWRAVARQDRGRGIWALVAAGLTLWFIGDVIWDSAVVATGELPTVSIADVSYLLGYVVFAGALIRLVLRRSGSNWRDGLVDGCAFAAVVGLAVWEYLIRPNTGADPLESIIGAAYPLADVLLLSVLAWVVLASGRRSPAFLVLTSGIVTVGLLDLGLAVMTTYGVEQHRAWLDNGYPVAYLLIAVGLLNVTEGDLAPVRSRGHLHPVRVAFLGTALIGAPVLGALSQGDRASRWAVVGVTSCVAMVVLVRFVTAVREVEAARVALDHAASHDSLTGLVNRGEIMEHLDGALARWAASDKVGFGQVVVFYLDLDRFKPVNDTYGHAAGDQLLQMVGERLIQSLRIHDTVGRLGGDEFCIVAERLDPAVAPEVGRRIVEVLSRPFELDCGRVEISASVGIAVPARPDCDADAVLADADAALYEVKRNGRSGFLLALSA